MSPADPRRAAALLGGLVLGGLVLGLAGCGGSGDDPVSRGRALASDLGCTTCHGADTTARIGPGWAHTWGTEVELEDGRSMVVDEAFLRRAITDPRADVRAGFNATMPQIPMSDEELDDLTAYLREVAGG